jgi:hypothetical protein
VLNLAIFQAGKSPACGWDSKSSAAIYHSSAFDRNNSGFFMCPPQIQPVTAHRSLDNTSPEHLSQPLNTATHNANGCHKSVLYTISVNRTAVANKVTMDIVVHIYCRCYGSKHVAHSAVLNSKPT